MSSKFILDISENKNLNNFILLLAFISILLPKINIIKFGELSHGLRFEDLFIIFFFLILVVKKKFFINYFPGGRLYFILYGFFFSSSFYSALNNNLLGFLVLFRWIEYSIFFYILMCTKFNLKMIIRFSQIILFVNFIVVLLQLNNLLPGLH